MTALLDLGGVAAGLLAVSVAVSARPPVGSPVVAAGLVVLTTVLYRGPAPWVLLALLAELPLLSWRVGRVVRRAPAPRAIVEVCAGAAALLLLPLRFTWADVPDPLSATAALVVGLGLVAVFAIPVGWQVYQRIIDRRRVTAMEQVRAETRLALARGLHDLVAHEITGVVLEAQASMLDGGAGAEALTRIEQAGQRALESMDDLIAQLSARTTAHRLEDLAALADRFASSGRATAHVTIDAPLAVALSAPQQALLYRCALEALTNVRRHAGDASHVALTVERAGPHAAQLVVTDDARAATPAHLHARQGPRPAGGAGLAALREDLERCGGRLEAAPREPLGGWQLTARVPLETSASDLARSGDGPATLGARRSGRSTPPL